MKTAVLLFAMAFGLCAQQPAPQITAWYASIAQCQQLAAFIPSLPPADCHAQEFVYVVDSATVQAFQIAVTYQDAAGNFRTRMQVLPAQSTPGAPGQVAAGTSFVFEHDVTVTSIQAAALDYVGPVTLRSLN